MRSAIIVYCTFNFLQNPAFFQGILVCTGRSWFNSLCGVCGMCVCVCVYVCVCMCVCVCVAMCVHVCMCVCLCVCVRVCVHMCVWHVCADLCMCVWYWLHWRCTTRWLLQVVLLAFKYRSRLLVLNCWTTCLARASDRWLIPENWWYGGLTHSRQFARCEWRADLEGNLVVHLSVYSHCFCFTTNSHSHFCSCHISIPFPVYRRKSSGTVGWLKFTTININMVKTHKVLVKIKNKSGLEMTYGILNKWYHCGQSKSYS